MVQGTVGDWLVDEGDQIVKGQEIVECVLGRKNNWQFNFPAIISYPRILALDFPSHGDFTFSTEQSCPSVNAQIVSAIIDHLDFEKVDLVGY